MPVRMEKDDPRQSSNQQSSSGRPNNLIKWLPFVLLFLFRKPKLLVPILLIGGVLWYFGFFDSFLGGGGGTSSTSADDLMQQFSMGAVFDQEKYDKASVYEPLATSLSYGNYNRLPSRVTLIDHAPKRLHQGQQGSCVGWASAYAARTILQSKATGKAPDQLAFSPSFLYNQIALSGCQGAYMQDAMKTMQQVGNVPFTRFGYDERTCRKRPAREDLQMANDFRIKGYNRLTQGANRYGTDLKGIKQHLAQGAPVVIGMMVGGTFMQQMAGREVWRPTAVDYAQRGYSGHAMCVIGYDDNKEGGAFQIMNSWGRNWGRDGIAWVKYRDFQEFVKEAYGLHPMGTGPQLDETKLQVEFGLIRNDNQQPITLQKVGDHLFRTKSPLQKGDQFKVLFANSIECYVYVFGQETDGSSYVLFPYTQKHSPYCGITGARLFPRDYSMTLDDIGNQDVIGLVISKVEIDYDNLNQLINQSTGTTYAEKLQRVLQSEAIRSPDFQTGQTVAMQADATQGNLVGVVIALDKR